MHVAHRAITLKIWWISKFYVHQDLPYCYSLIARYINFSHIRLSPCNIVWCLSIVSSPQCFIFSNHVWSSVHFCSLWILCAHWWIFLFIVSAFSEATWTCGEKSLSFYILTGKCLVFPCPFLSLLLDISIHSSNEWYCLVYIKIFYPVDSGALSCHNYSPTCSVKAYLCITVLLCVIEPFPVFSYDSLSRGKMSCFVYLTRSSYIDYVCCSWLMLNKAVFWSHWYFISY